MNRDAAVVVGHVARYLNEFIGIRPDAWNVTKAERQAERPPFKRLSHLVAHGPEFSG